MQSIASNMFSIHVHCDMDSLCFVCLGASADIQTRYGETLLPAAEKELARKSHPGEKQRLKKVHEDTNTITNLDIANGCCQKFCMFFINILLS